MSVSEPIATRRMMSLDADVLRIAQKVRDVGRALDERYLDKSELIRMLLVTLVAGEHMAEALHAPCPMAFRHLSSAAGSTDSRPSASAFSIAPSCWRAASVANGRHSSSVAYRSAVTIDSS